MDRHALSRFYQRLTVAIEDPLSLSITQDLHSSSQTTLSPSVSTCERSRNNDKYCFLADASEGEAQTLFRREQSTGHADDNRVAMMSPRAPSRGDGIPRAQSQQPQNLCPSLGVDVAAGSSTWTDTDTNEFSNDVTGFAVASLKRNTDFHDLFPRVAKDDYLIEDYGCALQREILVHGRLYISEHHLCFHANIFGWITNEVIPFSDIASLERKMTAIVIPNAIQISTSYKCYTFASFMGRDSVFRLMSNIWRLACPSGTDSMPPSVTDVRVSSNRMVDGHQATVCTCAKNKEHYPHVFMDAILPGTPENIYELLFASEFLKSFLSDEQHLTDVQMSDWCPVTAGGTLLKRTMSYIKPLPGGFGPKQTKCELRDEMVHFEPSRGNAFLVKTRTCITWAGPFSSRVVVNSSVEWTGFSLVKTFIEQGVIDGQKAYHQQLEPTVRKYIVDHRAEFVPDGVEDKPEDDTALPELPTPEPMRQGSEEMKPLRRHSGERWMQLAFDTLYDARNVAQKSVNGAWELFCQEVPTWRTVLFFVVFLLALTNIATLLASFKSQRPLEDTPHPTSTLAQAQTGMSTTLRAIMDQICTESSPEQQPALQWREEKENIERTLDNIERGVWHLRRMIEGKHPTE